MTLKTKVNSVVSYIEKGKKKTWGGGKRGDLQRKFGSHFRERVSSFSLSFCTIRPLAVVGTRGKVALRIEVYA